MQADGTKRRTPHEPSTVRGSGRPTLWAASTLFRSVYGAAERLLGTSCFHLRSASCGGQVGAQGCRPPTISRTQFMVPMRIRRLDVEASQAPNRSPDPKVSVANGKAARPAELGARRIRKGRFGCLILALCTLLQLAAAADEPNAAAEAPQPLPSLETVVRGLASRLEASESQRALFYERYRHVTTRIREERNTKGKLRERSEERTVHNPQASPKTDAENGPEPGQGRAYRERDVSIDAAVLQRFEFQVEGREDLEGRQVLRASFRPRDGELPKHNMLDRVINSMAGTLWLEEPSMALVRARLRLIESVDFWGGIAGAIYRLEMSYDCACTPDGLWYTRRGAWQVDYRKFLKRSVVESEELCEGVEPVTSR